jgi:NAD(P)H-dependent FMN reductase
LRALIVSGSHRDNSESRRISQIFMEHFLPDHFTDIALHDLSIMDLPFWEEAVWDENPEWMARLERIRSDLRRSDALIFVCPEWNGMTPPRMKNYFLFADEGSMRNKPALIVAISSGLGGAYVVSELRSSSYKNTKVCYIPEQLIIRNVTSAWTGASPFSDDPLAERSRFAVGMLALYADALKQVRASEVSLDAYPYGM